MPGVIKPRQFGVPAWAKRPDMTAARLERILRLSVALDEAIRRKEVPADKKTRKAR